MPDPEARSERWTIDFYDVDSGRMVGRITYDGITLSVDRVHSLVNGLAPDEIWARHQEWTDGEIESRRGRRPPPSPVAYVTPPDGGAGFVVHFIDDEATGQQAADIAPDDAYSWDIEKQIREWEEDPIGFTDTYGYVPTDHLPEDDARHGMRILVDGFDDDYNPIEDDDPQPVVDDEGVAQLQATRATESPALDKQPRLAPHLGGMYRTNTLIPQEYDPSISPGVLVEVLANHGYGGSEVRVVETGQEFFCPWGNLLPERDQPAI